MASRTATWHSGSRLLWYLAFGVLAAIPVALFAAGPLSSESFSLTGPGGPFLAFSAGVLSFVSPCVLPLVPIYITHLSGSTVSNGRVNADRRRTFAHAVAFVGGLSAVFIVLGVSAGLLGSYFLQDNQRDFERYAGFFLVLMGLVLIPEQRRRSLLPALALAAGLVAVYLFIADLAQLEGDRQGQLLLAAVCLAAWLRFAGYLNIPFLSRTFSFDTTRLPGGVSYAKSAAVGGAFALGWTPCIGPVLGSILTLAATSSDAWTGTYLLVAYSVGFSVPFLITGLALGDVTRVLRRIQSYAGFIEVASGLMLVAVGVLLVTGRLTGLNEFFGFAEFNQGL